MRHTSLPLIGVIILLIIETVIFIKVENLKAVTALQSFYNNALDNATCDSLFEVVDMDCVDVQQIDYAMVTQSFYNYLAMNLGLTLHSQKADMIPIYVPVVMYILRDGYYYACLKDDTSLFVSDFISFQSSYSHYTIQYTMTDKVKVIDKDTCKEYEGTYLDICNLLPDVLPSTYEAFDTQRRTIINKQIEATMNDCLTTHNRIAKHYGIRYQFSLPVIEREEWYNTVNDISMLTVFQAYPFGTPTLGYYNRVAFSGARIHK